MELSNAKEQVIKAGRELSRSGLIARTWGNVSCRTGEDTFVITASGRDYMTLTPQEIIEVKLSDLSYEGDIKPSSELKAHREIYMRRPDAQFIIHTHQNNASALSAMGVPRIRFTEHCPGIGYEIVCADYALPGTDALCGNVAEAFEGHGGNAVIMKNHGVICCGSDCESSFETAAALEEVCGRYLEALGIEPWREIPAYLRRSSDNENGALWNHSRTVIEFSRGATVLMPYLDDFAQIAGTHMKVIDDDERKIQEAMEAKTPVLVRGKGALCIAQGESDMEALSMVIEKNCRAYFAARLTAARPIKEAECRYMHDIYVNKYSKLF